MAWPEDIASNTPEKYQFKLITDTDPIGVICNPQPLEWKSGSLTMKRDLDLGGVFISFACDSLTFVGTGATFLKKIFEAYELGPGSKTTLIIYWWKEFDLVTPANGRRYIEFPTRFNIDYNFYEIVKVGRFHFGVCVKAVNNSVQTKLDSRQDIDIDINKLKSIGNFDITDYSSLKKGLHYDATYVINSAVLSKYVQNTQLYHTADVLNYTSIPLNLISSQFSEVQTVAYVTKQPLSAIPSFFHNALYDYDFDINYVLAVSVTDRYVGSFPWSIQILETNAASEIVNTYDLGGFGGIVKIYYFNGLETISVTKGNDLKLVVCVAGIDATYSAHMVNQYLTITQNIASAEATQTEGFPVYEAMNRILQHIMDVQYPFYSEFFGRTDVNYKDGVNYSSVVGFIESQLRFAHIQSGLNQRGLLLINEDGTTNPLVLNFKDLFKSIKAIWNVGYMLETLAGEDSPRVRIEEYAHFFDDTEVLDLSDRINKYDIQSQVMPELVPNDLKSGFDNFEYLSVNGRAEPNTTNQRTSVMNTATKFENISPLRGDTKGILDNLVNPIEENETIDTKGDSDIFIIKSQVDAVYGWKPEKAENITIEDETSLFKEDLLNRYFTPSRMLIRHGNRIKAGFMKYLTSVLRFQKTDKSSSLETTGTAQSGIDEYNITESADIVVSTLAAPIYLPMKHTVECLFTKADLELYLANPLGYFTYSKLPDKIITGFVLNLKMENNEDKAVISIIERYIPPPA